MSDTPSSEIVHGNLAWAFDEIKQLRKMIVELRKQLEDAEDDELDYEAVDAMRCIRDAIGAGCTVIIEPCEHRKAATDG